MINFSYFDNHLMPILFFSVIIVILSLVFIFNPKRKIIRILSKLPLKNVGSLKSNEFSKIIGKAKAIKEPMIAPYSMRKCLCYNIIIEQRRKYKKHYKWQTLVKEEKIQEFLVETGGDLVLVKPQQNPNNYISYFVADSKSSSSVFNEASINFENLLRKYNIKSVNFLGVKKRLRCREAVIEIGEEITVAGIVSHKILNGEIDGYNYSKIIELTSTNQQKLIITDLKHIKSK